MTTKKPKVAGYLDPTLYETFTLFAQTEGISESMAVNCILESFFEESMNTINSKQLNIRISPHLFEEIRQEGTKYNLSTTHYAIEALKFCVQNNIDFLPGNDMTSPTFNFRISHELLDELKAFATRNNTTPSSVVLAALQDYLESDVGFSPSGQSTEVDVEIFNEILEELRSEINSQMLLIKADIAARFNKLESRLESL